MWRRIYVILAVFVVCSVPTVGATNQTTNSTANITTAVYEDAVLTAATPRSYEQATVLFKAVGAEIAVVLGGLLIFLLLAAGAAGYWREDRFWAVFFLTFFAALVALIALPSMWMWL